MTNSPIHQAYGQPLPENQNRKDEARHDGLAVMSLIFAFLFFPLGILFGHLSNHAAKLASRKRSALAVVGLIVSYFWVAIIVIFIIAGIAGAHSGT
jgi:ABC-type antimicrobial peptide transport system permease subunit